MPPTDLTPDGVRERLADWLATSDSWPSEEIAARLYAAIEAGLDEVAEHRRDVRAWNAAGEAELYDILAPRYAGPREAFYTTLLSHLEES